MATAGDAKRKLNDAATPGWPGTWLIVFPASGTVMRVKGRFFTFDLGDGTVAPFVLADDGAPLCLDPRVLIVNDRTLVRAWSPREHLDHMHAGCAKWFADNPDVFQPSTGNGVTAFVAEDN